MHKLCVFVVRTYHKAGHLMTRLIFRFSCLSHVLDSILLLTCTLRQYLTLVNQKAPVVAAMLQSRLFNAQAWAKNGRKGKQKIYMFFYNFYYTPDIRSMWGYIVFAFPFVCLFVCSFVRLSVTGSKFLR